MTRKEKIDQFLRDMKKDVKKTAPVSAVYRERFYISKWDSLYGNEQYLTAEEVLEWEQTNKK